MVNHIIPWFCKQIPENMRKTVLITLDNCSVHTTPDVYELFLAKGFNLSYFPPNATPIIQPVDVGIGKGFKSNIKKSFNNWVINNF
jgi:hypothetical protein